MPKRAKENAFKSIRISLEGMRSSLIINHREFVYITQGGGGGGGSYFPYILLNKIETMFSQLSKQSHWKLSADCSIAHEHIRPVDLPVNTFPNGN